VHQWRSKGIWRPGKHPVRRPSLPRPFLPLPRIVCHRPHRFIHNHSHYSCFIVINLSHSKSHRMERDRHTRNLVHLQAAVSVHSSSLGVYAFYKWPSSTIAERSRCRVGQFLPNVTGKRYFEDIISLSSIFCAAMQRIDFFL